MLGKGHILSYQHFLWGGPSSGNVKLVSSSSSWGLFANKILQIGRMHVVSPVGTSPVGLGVERVRLTLSIMPVFYSNRNSFLPPSGTCLYNIVCTYMAQPAVRGG